MIQFSIAYKTSFLLFNEEKKVLKKINHLS
ncbi:hypothetical protein LCGC14_1114130 [marine sediment metagenome]|uniref:Uncharacterized protein n=1 Tax=marine sediment metagenome TaxID=412755 RepID=A0A0F9M5Y9_9ZZZZ